MNTFNEYPRAETTEHKDKNSSFSKESSLFSSRIIEMRCICDSHVKLPCATSLY